jgi:hypothetical protein
MPNSDAPRTTSPSTCLQHIYSFNFLYWKQWQAFKKPLKVWQNHFPMEIWQIKSMFSQCLATANH